MPDHVIHKYTLPFKANLDDKVEVRVRPGKLLHLAMQYNDVHAWALVDSEERLQAVTFRLVGTGGTADPGWHHLGTIMDGANVWHVFTASPQSIWWRP